MAFDFSTLVGIIKDFAKGPFLCVEFTGNRGDELLRQGFYNLMAQKNIIVGNEKNYSLIYLHGGGALNSIYTGEPIRAIRKLLHRYKNVVVGPSSVTPEYDFLKKWIPDTEKLTIFAREKISYNILRDLFKKTQIFLAPDTALYFYGKDQYLIDKYYIEKKEKKALTIYRSDNEKTLNSNHEIALLPLKEWLSFHFNASSIITNRLHSAIIGAIFKIPTQITHSSYHKNFGVWMYSLKDIGVEWFLPKKDRALGFIL
jgi:exopolysaccharide biosynthesis predicted pyruvyltransferase EpsI